jgi:hypothetical protein
MSDPMLQLSSKGRGIVLRFLALLQQETGRGVTHREVTEALKTMHQRHGECDLTIPERWQELVSLLRAPSQPLEEPAD